MQQLAKVELAGVVTDGREAIGNCGFAQAVVVSQPTRDFSAQRLARSRQVARTARFVLAQEFAGFGERQLLGIVAGEPKLIARRELRDGPRQRITGNRCSLTLVGAGFSRPNPGPAEAGPYDRRFIVRQRLELAPGAQAIDVSLRKHGAEPRRQTAASVEVTKKGSLEQLAVEPVSELPRAAARIERVGRAIQRRALFANEVFPRPFVAGGAAAGQREVFEMQFVEVGAAFGAPRERFSKPVERHVPALGACPAMKALRKRGVDRQPSHSTPGALVGHDAQQHAHCERDERASQLAAERGNQRRSRHDRDQA